MGKEPLITRSTLRKRREEQSRRGSAKELVEKKEAPASIHSQAQAPQQPTQQAHQVTRIPKTTLTREQPLIHEATPKDSGQGQAQARPVKKTNYGFYRKEKQVKPITKSRSVENQKSRELNGFLMRSIVVVVLLIVVVMLATFFL